MDTRRTIKKWVKYLIFAGGFRSGVLWLLQASGRKKHFDGLVVLNYHRIIDREEELRICGFKDISVTISILQAQLRQLKKKFRFLSLADVSSIIERGERFPTRTCLMTLDDGWKDNYDCLFPILKEEEIPAVIFVAGELCESGELYWAHLLWQLLLLGVVHPLDLLGVVKESMPGLPDDLSGNPFQVTNFFYRFFPLLDAADTDTRRIIREMVRQWSERYLPELRRRRFYLNGEEMREMLASGLVSFGAHGYNHDPLTWFSGRELEDQLKRPKDMLEKLIGTPVLSFSYPHSLFQPEVLRAAEAVGYRIGFQSASPCQVLNTTEYHPLALNRVPILHDLSIAPTGHFSPAIFNCQLKGIIY